MQKRFRRLLRTAHPDHGGESVGAAERIAELTEARELLLAGIAKTAPSRDAAPDDEMDEPMSESVPEPTPVPARPSARAGPACADTSPPPASRRS